MGTNSSASPYRGDRTAGVAPGVHTFLIADVRGYTQFTLDQGDESAAHLATRFAELVEETIAARDGRVIELRGDEALAVFGSARQALLAAVQLQSRISREGDAWPMKVGIGLDAGESIPVRDGFRGAALNLAARLCSLAGPGEALASDGVVHLARRVEGITYVERGYAQLKGFTEPVRVIEVLPEIAARPGGPTAESAPQRRLPIGGFLGALPAGMLVGRQLELARILDSVEVVAGGTGQLVLLAGEPGVGKTRLAQEVSVALRDRGFAIGTGRCYEAQAAVPFYPFVEALAALYALAPAAVRAEAGRRWPYLGQLLPDYDGTPLVASSSQEDQQRLFWSITGFVQTIAAVTPVAFLLDDLHWADGSSLELLQHLARATRGDRTLLLGTYRDVEVGRQHPLEAALRDLNREGLAQRIDVRRLDESGTASLIAETMGEEEISEEFTDLLYRRTEGNPFFIQQVLRVLVERGDVYRESGAWQRKAVGEIEVPESVRSVIGQRLSRLSEATQNVLREASVLGQTFLFDDLLAVIDGDELSLERALEESSAAGLVRAQEGDRYAFDHALTQGALYAELSPRRRKRLHAAAGAAIEGMPDRKRDGRAAELSWHFLQADDVERGLRWSILAGDQAEAVFAHSDAELHYRTAVELGGETADEARQVEAMAKLGNVLTAAARYDEALDVLTEAVQLYRRLGDRAGETRVLAAAGTVHSYRGTPQEGLELIEGELHSFESAQPSKELAQLYLALTHLSFRAGDFAATRSAAERTMEIAGEIGDERILAQGEMRLGTVGRYGARSGVEESMDLLRQAEARAERVGDLSTAAVALNNLAFMCLLNGRLVQNFEYRSESLEIGDRTNDPAHRAFGLTMVGQAHYYLGRLDSARELADLGIDIVRGLSVSWYSVYPVLHGAWIAVATGHREEADTYLEESADLLRPEDRNGGALLRTVAAERYLLRREPAAALSVYDGTPLDRLYEWEPPFMCWACLEAGDDARALEAVERALEYPLNAEARAIRGLLLARRGRREEAGTEMRLAVEETRAMKYRLAEGRSLHWAGVFHGEAGESVQARARFEEALAVFAEIGAGGYVQRTEQALAEL